jgi:hypothetical protein
MVLLRIQEEFNLPGKGICRALSIAPLHDTAHGAIDVPTKCDSWVTPESCEELQASRSAVLALSHKIGEIIATGG